MALHHTLYHLGPFLIIHALFTIFMVIRIIIIKEDLIEELLEGVRIFWDEGNIFGKFLTAIAAFIGFILLTPALIITLLLWLLENILSGILMLAFPNTRPCEKQIPLPDKEVLQKFRDNNIYFVIGKDHISFKYLSDYQMAKKILEEGTIADETKKNPT